MGSQECLHIVRRPLQACPSELSRDPPHVSGGGQRDYGTGGETEAQSRTEAGPRSCSRPMTEWGPCPLVRGDLPKTHCFKGLMEAAQTQLSRTNMSGPQKGAAHRRPCSSQTREGGRWADEGCNESQGGAGQAKTTAREGDEGPAVGADSHKPRCMGNL